MEADSEECAMKADKRAGATVRSRLSEAGKSVLVLCEDSLLPPGMTSDEVPEAFDKGEARE